SVCDDGAVSVSATAEEAFHHGGRRGRGGRNLCCHVQVRSSVSSVSSVVARLDYLGRIFSTSVCGLGITWTETSSPTRRAAAAPASVAALTAPTSPRTMTVTYPAPMYSLPTSVTLAAFTIASAASTEPMRPLVSTS